MNVTWRKGRGSGGEEGNSVTLTSNATTYLIKKKKKKEREHDLAIRIARSSALHNDGALCDGWETP